jgi:hypothetical protein
MPAAIARHPRKEMPKSNDPDERRVEALAETIRRGIEGGTSDEGIELLARAALGDEDQVDQPSGHAPEEPNQG